MDSEKINLIGRWVITAILACAGVACIFTNREDYAGGLIFATIVFWMLSD